MRFNSRSVIVLVVALVGMLTSVHGAHAEEFSRYALESVSTGLSSGQAGGHADFTTTFGVTYNGEGEPYALTRDIQVRLPAGLFGDPQAFPTCTSLELGTTVATSKCPVDSQIGETVITLGGALPGTFPEPVYNMPAPGGDVIARLGFFAGPYPAAINVRLDPSDDRLVATAESVPAAAALISASTTIWGIPAESSHDVERITPAEAIGSGGPVGGRKSSLPDVPFMTNPTACGASAAVAFKLTSYAAPVAPIAELEAPLPAIAGCGVVGFSPTVAAKPTSERASTGSGLDYEASFSTKGLRFGNVLYDSEAKRVEVTLPEGMTVNPSEAVGLGVCSEADLARETYDSPPNAGCPETSKIGTITAPTPVLEETPEGALYLAAPYANPFHTLLALYLVVKVPDRGVLVKLQGKVEPNPLTGQLTSVFDDIPQLPVGSFRLHFREGARAPLVTPPVCGTFTTTSRMEPWSAPGASVLRESTFQITKGIDNGACPSGGVPPFAPTVVAGTTHNLAGAYSPLSLRLERQDGEQEITGFSTQMPAGLTGNLRGIPFCTESEIQRARSQTGAEAETELACPAASQIGSTLAEAGVGSVLAQTPGKLYLAGPFEGAPFSVVDVTSAKVGPFDLGTVVVHLPLRIDPVTAQVSIPTGPADQIPHIIDGIVIHLRSISVFVSREDFIINPTSCEPKTFTTVAVGSGANFASSADDQQATINSPFEDVECSHLAFKPTFKASTSGKTSRTQGASLHVSLAYPKEALGKDANIRSVKVDLPKQLPSRLTTLQKACTAAQFTANPAGCPAGSRVGVAKALTPILSAPLEGPAYFVSYGGAKFPELVIVLQGEGLTIQLHGETFISKAGVTSSTFRAVPDQPVENFELTLPEGRYSALAANGNLCASKLKMPTAFTAQNGSTFKQSTPIAVTGCPKHKAKKVNQKAKKARSGQHGGSRKKSK